MVKMQWGVNAPMVRTYGQDVIELLAPAGDMSCLHAAVRGGADAVYLGLPDFNARRNADNFTLETLAEACTYAHLRGVSIYVTLNTEILAGELPRAVELAVSAYEAGADAFITGEAKHSDFVAAKNAGFTLVVCGHFETEDIAVAPLAALLKREVPGVTFIECHKSPVNHIYIGVEKFYRLWYHT